MTGRTRAEHARRLARAMEIKMDNLTAFQKTNAYLDATRPLRYGVGFDGSRLSNKCFEVCCNIAQQKEKGDRVYVLHVETLDSKAGEVERLLKDIQLTADTKLIKITWFVEKQLQGESICTALMRLTEKIQLDFVVLGSYGVTAEGNQIEMHNFLEGGANVLGKTNSGHIVGKTNDESLRACDTSIILVKTTTFKLAKSRTWVLATDHSEGAQSAFALLLRMVQKGDKVHIWFATELVSHTTVLEMYKTELAKRPDVTSRVSMLEVQAGISCSDAVVNAAKQIEADVIVAGISGYNESKLGSFSMAIARDSRCITMLAKDPREVTMLRVSRSNFSKYIADAALY
eukprot:CAMPEP_0198209632 /NCGR_PEP_ID=MMETSP1445-20131203/17635_1 /TAXON_ID=36898 /ORGANISM="Pyramimonas sp., Strain CCMP2087" /LENGTH=343 /DNA_ID=CAMNT_0043883475 /DNA_START=219 /DNA_END=1250 /DNA_ORIENTATION=-